MPANPLVTEILQRLRSFREAAGASREDLEARLILGPGWIEQFESGEAVPTIDQLLVILHLLGVPPGSLFNGLAVDDGVVQFDRLLFAEPIQDALRLHFRYGDFDATYALPGARLDEFEEVLREMRDGLAAAQPGIEESSTIKTDAVVNAFLRATAFWPGANPSDLWWFLVYRAYMDPFNHPASEARRNFDQSWKRTSGWALEQVLVQHYGSFLRARGVHISVEKGSRKQALLSQLEVPDRLVADKVDVLLSGEDGGSLRCFGVVHVKASFAERRTDDVPMSRTLVAAGYTSPLWTMDCKSMPSPRPRNHGELGDWCADPASKSDKRKDIEDDGYFSACFSYNRNTIGTPAGRQVEAPIICCDFSDPDDAFSEFILQRWQQFRSR